MSIVKTSLSIQVKTNNNFIKCQTLHFVHSACPCQCDRKLYPLYFWRGWFTWPDFDFCYNWLNGYCSVLSSKQNSTFLYWNIPSIMVIKFYKDNCWFLIILINNNFCNTSYLTIYKSICNIDVSCKHYSCTFFNVDFKIKSACFRSPST